jgi:hypothetical protein
MSKAPDQYEALIGTVYHAALDPALWQNAVAETCCFLDCRYGALGSADLLRSEVKFTVTYGYTPRDRH